MRISTTPFRAFHFVIVAVKLLRIFAGMLPLLFVSLLGQSSAAAPFKRGLAYDLKSAADFAAVAPGVSWWYNWAPKPENEGDTAGLEFVPMLWDFNFDADDVVNYITANNISYFLVLNEPNLVEQANQTPQQAARNWTRYEDVATRTGAKLVGPQISWGTMENYGDPILWMDAFYEAYRYAKPKSPKI